MNIIAICQMDLKHSKLGEKFLNSSIFFSSGKQKLDTRLLTLDFVCICRSTERYTKCGFMQQGKILVFRRTLRVYLWVEAWGSKCTEGCSYIHKDKYTEQDVFSVVS